MHVGKHLAREPGDPRPSRPPGWRRDAAGSRETHAADARVWEVRQPRSTQESPEQGQEAAAEGLEGRRLAKRNLPQATTLRTQGRARVQAALGRVRQVAEQKKGERFTALLHHIYATDTLRAAFYNLERDAAPGVDGETWEHYGEDLEANLAELSDRLDSRYRASAQFRSAAVGVR